MKKCIYALLCIYLFIGLSSCISVKIVEEDRSGTWDINFNGDLRGSGKFNITSNKNISSGNILLSHNISGRNYSIKGLLVNTVLTKGSIWQGNDSIGKIEGTFTFETGTGVYTVNDSLDGGWTAKKR